MRSLGGALGFYTLAHKCYGDWRLFYWLRWWDAYVRWMCAEPFPPFGEIRKMNKLMFRWMPKLNPKTWGME